MVLDKTEPNALKWIGNPRFWDMEQPLFDTYLRSYPFTGHIFLTYKVRVDASNSYFQNLITL
jgi:hypothetical protein